MSITANPFFWAFVSMFGLFMGIVSVSGIKLGPHNLLKLISYIISDGSRLILVMPFCLQPRIGIGAWRWTGIIGAIIAIAALVYAVSLMFIDTIDVIRNNC